MQKVGILEYLWQWSDFQLVFLRESSIFENEDNKNEGFENKIVSDVEFETEHCVSDAMEDNAIISCDTASDIDQDCSGLIRDLEQTEFREANDINHEQVDDIDICMEHKNMAKNNDESDEYQIQSDEIKEEILYNEPSEIENEKNKNDKVHALIKDVLLTYYKSEKSDKVQKVKSDQFIPTNVDVNIDGAKKVEGKCDFEINVFHETLVKPIFVSEKVPGTGEQGDFDSNSIYNGKNMDLITNTQLDIDNKRKTENPIDNEDTKHNEKDTKEERKCLKDETIFDVKDGNNLEEEEKEHSAQSITIDSPVGISESILDDKVMSDTTTDVSTNVGDRKIEHTGVY